MRVVVFGGAGFVGLNIAEHLLAAGDEVVLFDKSPPPAAALEDFARLPGRFTVAEGDVDDAATVAASLGGADAVVYGAAVTSDALREAAAPRSVLEVNLMGWLTVLEAARPAGVRRLVNLSSASAYGDAAFGEGELDEAATTPDPRTLYAVSKVAGERVGARLADLWGLDVRSVRLSAVFGPWERATGVRDTLSPPFQVMRAALAGEPVRFERHDVRDWVYAPDVARAVAALLGHPAPAFDLYNIGPGTTWDLVAWAERLRLHFPSLVPVVDPNTATIRTHAPTPRQPLAAARLREDLGVADLRGGTDSADAYAAWAIRHRAIFEG